MYVLGFCFWVDVGKEMRNKVRFCCCVMREGRIKMSLLACGKRRGFHVMF